MCPDQQGSATLPLLWRLPDARPPYGRTAGPESARSDPRRASRAPVPRGCTGPAIPCAGLLQRPAGRTEWGRLHATAGRRVRATRCRDRPCRVGLPRLQAWFGAYATQSSTRCFGRPGSAIERRAILNPRPDCPLLCTSGIAPGAPESFCPHSRRDPAGVPQRRLSPP